LNKFSSSSCFPLQIDLPRNNLFYRGYATITFSPTFTGLLFCF
jgi:hypothetical protein